MRFATAVFSLVSFGSMGLPCVSSAESGVSNVTLYETHDAQVGNELPCYRLGLGAMLDDDGRLERDGVYRGSAFILRTSDAGDCTRWFGEAAYDDDHSFFIELLMDPTCAVPKSFRAELKQRHDRDGVGYGVAVCKKLRRDRGRR